MTVLAPRRSPSLCSLEPIVATLLQFDLFISLQATLILFAEGLVKISGLLKNEGVQQMEVRTLGGETGRGQDVTIILVPKGESIGRVLARIHLHSHVLSTHSKYFNKCLSEKRNHLVPPYKPIEFVLEVQTDVQHYFNCFSNMYSPFGKSFESVERSLELLKVASQIEFGGLMERVSFCLSSMYWSEEEEFRVQKYATSPDFPHTHLKDLVARLGLDESKDDRQKQLYVLVNGVLQASCTSSALTLPAFLEAIRCAPPSEYSRKVVAILTQAAKKIFADIDREFNRLFQYNIAHTRIYIDRLTRPSIEMLQAVSWILEALLKSQVAEELVQGIVHFDKIPKCISLVSVDDVFSKREFAELVLLMYKEVVAGRLVLKPPERMALLANWHKVLKSSLKVGNFEQATANLFLTLPLKQQAELIQLQEGVFDFISTSSFAKVLHFH